MRPSFRPTALTVLVLSLLACATGLIAATGAYLHIDDDPQAGIGVVLGLGLAIPAAVFAALAGTALTVHRTRPGLALGLLVAGTTGVAAIALALAVTFLPALLG